MSMGFVPTMTTVLTNVDNKNNLLLWQLINDSQVDVNELVFAIKTLNCRTEAVD